MLFRDFADPRLLEDVAGAPRGTRAGSGDGHAWAGGGLVRCRCCPDGMSRSIRTPRYPPDMSDAECAVTEPTLAATSR